MQRTVSAYLDLDITDPTEIELQVAVARSPGLTVVESLTCSLDGVPVETRELAGAHGGRLHLLHGGVGRMQISYDARIEGRAEPAPVDELDLSVYRRPSRYAEADKFYGYAAREFDFLGDPAELLATISSWVGTRLAYVPGSSGPTDGATETLLASQGVCRDYTHLVVALLRALNIPARLVAVYAPGCDPMDFHAVVEAHVAGAWHVVDATLLAPRSTLVRISTGRDAADTAFLTNHGGTITLNAAVVTAVVGGDLPSDDLAELVSLG